MALWRLEVTTQSFRWTCLVAAPNEALATYYVSREIGGAVTACQQLTNPVYVVDHQRIRTREETTL